MVLRTWRGSTRTEDADEYVEYLRQTGIREYRATPGNRGVYLVRRRVEHGTEFLLVTLWDSMKAVEAFAGNDPDVAVFYPEDARYLVESDDRVNHYEVLEGEWMP